MPTNKPQNLRTSTRPPRNRAITLLAVGHACVDVYQGAVAALVPFFVAERAYTYAAASGIVLAASLLSSVAQPLFGALTDRKPLPWLLPVSTLVGGLGIALSGLGDSYALTLFFVAVSGLGVAAYHPESARIARTASRGGHTAMSWFSLGGNLGFAFSPALVALVVGLGGLTMSPLLLLPALAGSVLCLPALRIVQHGQGTPSGTAHRTPALTPATEDRRSFLRLTLGVICRSVVFIGLSTFISLHMAQSTGWGPTAGTAALVVLYFGGAIGTVLGGRLAERWDRVTIIRRSYLLTVLAVAGVALTPGPLGYLFVALASAGLYVPFSLQVTLAQDYLPNHVGTAGGITLGLTVSVGGIVAPAIGLLADATNLRTALIPLVAMPALSWLAFRGLPEPAATIGPACPTTPVEPPSEKAESP
ncbi:MFS transporter [Streptomyces sp. NBC_01207]|uniref:MFS transporter n=1 Tax=Streptomyces sp. NBC_01207 TaxID=2903772 RepID=UPI002E1066E8|nr:MFS transporter [Streptomyces sp. NBC_01207]